MKKQITRIDDLPGHKIVDTAIDYNDNLVIICDDAFIVFESTTNYDGSLDAPVLADNIAPAYWMVNAGICTEAELNALVLEEHEKRRKRELAELERLLQKYGRTAK